LHDAVSAERAGTPAVAIMTSAFVDGARLMATTLGAPGYQFAVIDHPIASSTDRELARKAELTVEQANELVQPVGASQKGINDPASSPGRWRWQHR
jgi:hypothetical protein